MARLFGGIVLVDWSLCSIGAEATETPGFHFFSFLFRLGRIGNNAEDRSCRFES